MNPQKVLLYYGFTPINDPVAVQLWQKTLCETLNLKGRILISPTGINGTVGGDIDDLRKYVKNTKKYPGFKKIAFKWSQGTGNEFPKLYIAVKKELVAFDNPDEIKVDENGVIGGGTHLRPEQGPGRLGSEGRRGRRTRRGGGDQLPHRREANGEVGPPSHRAHRRASGHFKRGALKWCSR